jgi:hypothetical protein
MSSAKIESVKLTLARFSAAAVCSEPRKPVTTTSSRSLGPSAGAASLLWALAWPEIRLIAPTHPAAAIPRKSLAPIEAPLI